MNFNKKEHNRYPHYFEAQPKITNVNFIFTLCSRLRRFRGIQKSRSLSLTILVGFLVACNANFAAAQEHCMRGVPEPAFPEKSKRIKATHFRLINSHEAIEQIELASSAKIHIRHWGCEYYVITFSITPPGGSDPIKRPTDAITVAAKWLRALQPMKKSLVFDFALAAGALEEKLRSSPDVGYRDEIQVIGDGKDFLQTIVTVDEPKLGSAQIIFSLFVGPL